MTTSTLTITDFLLARIADDEAVAERAGSFTPWTDTFQNDNYGHLTVQPARILAECAAKRAIVELHSEMLEVDRDTTVTTGCSECAPDSRFEDGQTWPCRTIRALASVYADHADYRDEWRL